MWPMPKTQPTKRRFPGKSAWATMSSYLVLAFSLAGGALVALSASPAAADLVSFELKNHPDGAKAPPPYGLRLDGIEWWATDGAHGGENSTWTFDFMPDPLDCPACGVTGTLDTIAQSFTISGVAYGGKDIGAAHDGPGRLEIDFTYSNVTIGSLDGFPSVEAFGDPNGMGSVTFLDDNRNIEADTVVDLMGKPAGTKPFLFQADDHRLDGFCPGDDACGLPVGRGWLKFVEYDSYDNVVDSHETNFQDWLFTSQPSNVPVPEPATLALFGFGLAGLGVMSRRRKLVERG